MSQSEAASDEATVAKKTLDLPRCCVGGHIEVFRFPAQHEISDTASDKMSDKPIIMQPVKSSYRIGADGFAGNVVFFSGDNQRCHKYHHITAKEENKRGESL
jgi:hypothetical protein